MEHADTSTQTQLSQGSTEMLDLDRAPALKTCRRNHQHAKSEIHILSFTECLFLTFIKCNRIGSTMIYSYRGKYGSIGGFFLIPYRVYVPSDSREVVINLQVQE